LVAPLQMEFICSILENSIAWLWQNI
jgi:hypothetical protein